MKKIILKINKEGKATVQVEGVIGDACVNETARLLDKLGETQEQEHTLDYFEINDTLLAKDY